MFRPLCRRLTAENLYSIRGGSMMKKVVVFLVLVLMLGSFLLFTGCEKKEAEAAAEEAVPEEPADPVTIRFWNVHDNGIKKDAMEAIVSGFNEKYKGKITVEALAINFWDYWDKLSVSMAAGEEPDVFLHDLGNVGSRADTGILLDLTSYLKADGIDPDKEYFSAFIDMCKYKDGIYAFPFEPDIRMLFYNKDLFKAAGLDPEKPPTTFDKMWEWGNLLTTKNDSGGYDQLGLNLLTPRSQSYFQMYAWGNNVEFVKDGVATVNSPEAVKALTEWKAMIDNFGADAIQQFGADFSEEATDAFLVGKQAMSVHINDFYSKIGKYAPDMNFGVVPIPYRERNVSWSNGYSIELSSRSENKQAAYEFAAYLMSPEVQIQYVKDSNALSVRKAAAKSADLASDPYLELCSEVLEITQFRAFVLESPRWYGHLQNAQEEVRYGKSTPQDALDQAQKLIEMDIEKYKMTN